MILTASFFLWPLEAICPDIFPTHGHGHEPLSEIKIDVKSFQNQKAEGRNNSSLRFARNGPGGIRTPDTVVRSHVL
jgi:hypothetical protein